MSRYAIPEHYIPSFAVLQNLSDSAFDTVLDIIAELPLGHGSKNLTDRIHARIGQDASASGMNSMIGPMIFSVVGLLNDSPETPETVAADLASYFLSLFEYDNKEEEVSERDKFIGRLTQLVQSVGSLSTTYKAFSLLSETDRRFRKAHILSDLRTIFPQNIQSETPHSALVVHQLKLATKRGQDADNVFISLTTPNLRQLQQQIERALQKEDHLKQAFGGTVNFIELQE